MTFVEAAIEILKQEGRPLSVKKLTELAIARKLLSLVGKDPEGQMQARLTAEVKKTTGETPLNRGSAAGIFGLKVFPPRSAVKPPPAPEPEPKRAHHKDGDDVEKGKRKPAAAKAAKPKAKPEKAAPEKVRRGRAKPEPAAEVVAAPPPAPAPAAPAPRNRADEGPRRRRRRGGGGGGDARHAGPAHAAPESESAQDDQAGQASAEEFTGENTHNDQRPPLPEPPREPSRPPVTMSFDQAAVRVREEGRAGELPFARPEPRPEPRPPLPAPEPRAPAPEPAPYQAYQAPPQPAPMADDGAFSDAGDSDDEGDEGEAGDEDEGDDRDQGGDEPQGQGREGDPQGSPQGQAPGEGDQPGQPPRPRQPEVVHISRDQQAFRSVPLADAAHEVLRTQADGRPVHYRQIADMAVKRRLVRPDAPDIWRALRAAMLQESRDRQSQGLRPRIRHHGNGLFALATRRLEPELVNGEKELAAKHAELRALTRIALRRRLVRLPQTAFEHLVRVLLERAGYSELAMVKRGEGVTYYSAAQSRGALGVKTLVGMRAGEGELGRKAVGELRAGVRVKQLDEGLLVGAGKLSPDGTQEARAGLAVGGAAITAIDGDALADLLIRHGVGVLKVQLPVEYLDPELFADLSEG